MAYALSTSSTNENDPTGLLNYPRSRASAQGDSPIVRNRTWSEDITKTWNMPITGVETFEERVNRYLVYFAMTDTQLKTMLQKLRSEVVRGLEDHRNKKTAPIEPTSAAAVIMGSGVPDPQAHSLKMLDTYVTVQDVPKGLEKGTAYVLEFGSSARARLARVTLEGNSNATVSEVSSALYDAATHLPNGLRDRQATASMLFDTLVKTVQTGIEKFGGFSKTSPQKKVEVPVVLSFPLEHRTLVNANLMHWTKGFETGRGNMDPVEGQDIGLLLNCAFSRNNNIPAKAGVILNDTTSTLLAAMYEEKTANVIERAPPVKAAFVLGNGVNGCYVQPNAKELYGYQGTVINCELSSFDKSLPLNDVDLEVDFADGSNIGSQPFEKLTATTYLGEICRRLVVKVWQNDAPPLAWVRHSFPWMACARVVADISEDLSDTRHLLDGLWEWKTSVEQRRTVRRLFEAVFERSASLAAVAIASIAAQTDRLQPAMGGVTVAIAGLVSNQLPQYMEKLKNELVVILGAETAKLIHIREVAHATVKGAGVLTVCRSELL